MRPKEGGDGASRATNPTATVTEARRALQWAGLFAGPLLAAAIYGLLPTEYTGSGGEATALPHAARATAAVAIWMAVWWMSEAIPVYATALLPLALLPLLGAVPIRAAATPYGHPLIFLFMGGFILALAMQRWGLDRRIALGALRVVGTQPRFMVAGFMGVTAFLSMWVSNTATSVMMLPIALSVIALVAKDAGDDAGEGNLPLCLLLGIAYAASIGGIGTLIGTPPNVFLASFAQDELGVEISMARWLGVGLPLVAVFLPLTWWLLTRVVYPVRAERIEGGAEVLRREIAALGAPNAGEKITAVVFLLTATLWVSRSWLAELGVGDWRPLAGLSDPGIAMLAALALFAIPVDPRRHVFVMDWETARGLPWGLLVLFGGGLSLAGALEDTGVSAFLASGVALLAGVPDAIVVVLTVALVIGLTELTSNTATTATFLPILAAIARGIGIDPLVLVVPAAIAASCAFMLPVATPPNAVVFGSGRVSLPQMARAGIWLNLIGIGLITALAYAIALPLLGV